LGPGKNFFFAFSAFAANSAAISWAVILSCGFASSGRPVALTIKSTTADARAAYRMVRPPLLGIVPDAAGDRNLLHAGRLVRVKHRTHLR
jgi:hypothetical protein